MVELIDELTCNAEKLAIHSFHLHIDKLILEESNVKREDMGEGLQVSRRRIKLEYVKIGKEGIETAIVVDIYALERIHIDASIFKDLAMVLTGDIIHDFLLVETSSQQRVVEEKEISNDFLVYY